MSNLVAAARVAGSVRNAPASGRVRLSIAERSAKVNAPG